LVFNIEFKVDILILYIYTCCCSCRWWWCSDADGGHVGDIPFRLLN